VQQSTFFSRRGQLSVRRESGEAPASILCMILAAFQLSRKGPLTQHCVGCQCSLAPLFPDVPLIQTKIPRRSLGFRQPRALTKIAPIWPCCCHRCSRGAETGKWPAQKKHAELLQGPSCELHTEVFSCSTASTNSLISSQPAA
jgi:hypothetical protein